SVRILHLVGVHPLDVFRSRVSHSALFIAGDYGMGIFNGHLDQFLDIDHLRSYGATPHWFGLGFIQLKLTNDTRIHFWHPALMADTPEEELHDHRYRFHSHILLGNITHEEWFLEENAEGDHE